MRFLVPHSTEVPGSLCMRETHAFPRTTLNRSTRFVTTETLIFYCPLARQQKLLYHPLFTMSTTIFGFFRKVFSAVSDEFIPPLLTLSNSRIVSHFALYIKEAFRSLPSILAEIVLIFYLFDFAFLLMYNNFSRLGVISYQ